MFDAHFSTARKILGLAQIEDFKRESPSIVLGLVLICDLVANDTYPNVFYWLRRILVACDYNEKFQCEKLSGFGRFFLKMLNIGLGHRVKMKRIGLCSCISVEIETSEKFQKSRRKYHWNPRNSSSWKISSKLLLQMKRISLKLRKKLKNLWKHKNKKTISKWYFKLKWIFPKNPRLKLSQKITSNHKKNPTSQKIQNPLNWRKNCKSQKAPNSQILPFTTKWMFTGFAEKSGNSLVSRKFELYRKIEIHQVDGKFILHRISGMAAEIGHLFSPVLHAKDWLLCTMQL